MNNISLVKLESLCVEVVRLMDDETVEQTIYEDMISSIKKIEVYIEANKKQFVKDADRMLTVCKYMIFNLMLKITEVLQNGFQRTMTRH